MGKTLRRMGVHDATVHDFRSSFRDWCGEETNFPREIAEAALAHVTATRRNGLTGAAMRLKSGGRLWPNGGRLFLPFPQRNQNRFPHRKDRSHRLLRHP